MKKIRRHINGINVKDEIDAQIELAMRCRNVVKIESAWGFWDDSGCLYVQMEFCPGGSLEDCWSKEEQIEDNIEINQFTVHPDNPYVPSAQLVLEQINEALIACDERGLAHLDIKPANILIMHLTHVKLGDFGQVHTITQTGSHADANAQTPGCQGTEGFIAPEMGVNTNMDWSKADIYSLGATIWMLVMLRWPGEADKVGPGNHQLWVNEEDWPPLPGRGRPGLVDLTNSMLKTTQPKLRPSAREVKAFFAPSADESHKRLPKYHQQ